jgi:hypothetical protein
VSGDASVTPNGGTGTAHFVTPEETTKELPKGTLFPMAHTDTILAAAEAGKKVIGVPLFDGTTASGAQDSAATAPPKTRGISGSTHGDRVESTPARNPNPMLPTPIAMVGSVRRLLQERPDRRFVRVTG